MPSKPTYPHSSTSLVPEECKHSLEPCALETQGCYKPVINFGFQLIIDDLLLTGTTKAPNAWLVHQEETYNVWKLHWQRGNTAGPGHCIAVFQYKNLYQPFQGQQDWTSHSCFAIPAPCSALDIISSSSSPSTFLESLTP
ncbi:NS7b [Deltacoronavirus HNU2]|nr:NS7b [Deltacoronavirus HNU2]